MTLGMTAGDETSGRVVHVEIQGQRYPIRSALDAVYVAELARHVDGTLQAASDQTRSADSVKVAVIAALNIADEYFRAREVEERVDDELARRTEALERLLDRAIAMLD